MKYVILTILSFLILFGCTKEKKSIPERKQTNSKIAKKIFILHSYEDKNICGLPQQLGIINAFSNSKFDPQYNFYYMDTKIANVTPEKQKMAATKAISEISKFNPDILFVLDDNAFSLVALKLTEAKFPIVFSGLNKQPSLYNKEVKFLDENLNPIKNITGVFEYLHINKSFQVIKKIIPQGQEILAIIDTTPTGEAVYNELLNETSNTQEQFNIRTIRISTMNEYIEAISKANKDSKIGAIYNCALSLKKEDGTRIGANGTFTYYLKNCHKPAIAINYEFSRLGLFGGAAVDFQAMGEQAGKIGIDILNGKPINQIPIQNAEKYMVILNKARAKMLDIKIPQDIEMIADEIYTTIPLLEVR